MINHDMRKIIGMQNALVLHTTKLAKVNSAYKMD